MRSNAIGRDVRVPKEIRSLLGAGYSVTLLSWEREGAARTAPAGYDEIQFRCRAPWGAGVLLFLPLWWGFVLVKLLAGRWDIVHALNIDCAIPAIIAARLKRRPAIYEVLDIYEDEIVLARAVRAAAMFVDKIFMRLADAIVLADAAQEEGVGGIPNKTIVPVYDSPPGPTFSGETAPVQNGEISLFYAGVLYRGKRLNLDKVFDALRDIEGARLVIAGYGDLAEEIRELSARLPGKIEFIGQISYEEVIERGLQADLFFNLRDPVVPANRYTCGSTLLNAMSVGRPVLVNKGTSTAAKVAEEACGIVVDAASPDEVKAAIVLLRDAPELRREMGASARRAYEQRYSWEIQERRLLELYDNLTGGGRAG